MMTEPELTARLEDVEYGTDCGYWRVQDAGHLLSSSHRSRTWGDEPGDAGQEHAGTSCVRSLDALSRAQADAGRLAGRPAVELIWFDGDEQGLGWDGEPVVLPTRELLRWRLDSGQWIAALHGVSHPSELPGRGWVAVDAREVA